MKVLYSSDIHTHPLHLERLLHAAGELSADTVVIGGDVIPVRAKNFAAGIEAQREWVRTVLLPRLAAFHGEHPQSMVYFDFGNDDFLAARALLELRNGEDFTLVHDQVVPLANGWLLVGYMCVPPTPFRIKDWEKADCLDRTGFDPANQLRGSRTDTGVERPYELSLSQGTIQEDLRRLGALLAKAEWQEAPFMLVSHSPPLGTNLDRIHGGGHVGSLAIRRFIEQWGSSGRLRVSLHGHIHESPQTSGRIHDELAGVPCFNVGQESSRLRTLFFDSADILGSARLIIAGGAGRTMLTGLEEQPGAAEGSQDNT
jgi:Icc-related predicted phosphoesterase